MSLPDRRRWWTPAAVAVATLLVGALVPTVANAAASRAPSRTRTAHALVATLSRAHTPAARRTALLATMRRLHVAVVTAAGRPLVPRADVARHAALYDFELVALGNARARGERVTVADLAARLDAAGLHRSGSRLTAAVLARSLATAVRDAARHPRSSGALPGLVLRELGRADRPRVDMAKLRAADSLDPVQAELLLVGVAQVVYGSSRPTRRSADVRAHGAAATGGCATADAAKDVVLSGGNDGLTGSLMRKVLKGIVKKSTLSAAAQKALKLAGEILDGVHGSALAFSVSVAGDPESAGPVHYGHSATEHNVLTMRIRVVMLDDYGKLAVRCGPLAGLTFPKKGGIPDVPMHWETAGLDQHGQVICGAGCNTTDRNGVATLTVALKDEQIPGYGLEQEATGVADAIPSYQSAFGAGLADPSFWAQFAIPKYSGVRWHITWHKEPNLSLRVTTLHDAAYTDALMGVLSHAGTGASHFELGANVPLALLPTADGTSGWSGSAPLAWTSFAYDDVGVVTYCQGPDPSHEDHHGTAPLAGALTVDAVQKDAATVPGVSVVLHESRTPSYTDAFTVFDDSSCGLAHSGSFSRDFSPLRYAAAAPGVQTLSISGGHETYRVTGFQAGPPSGGGEGVYAYRDLPYATTDPYGQPINGRVRLELVATPAP